MPVLPRSRADVQIGDAVGPGSGCQEHTLRTSPSSTSWEMPPTYSSPLSPAMPHWRHLLLPSELPCCSTTVMPQTCWFEVLTLLPLSESTVSCWVSVSMGLPSNTSSSTLALASPIVLPEIVICGGCPNFIFLANCCWKTKRGKKKKKGYLYYEQNKSSLTCACSPHGSCTEIRTTTTKTNSRLTLLQHDSHPIFILPTKWPRSGIHCISSHFGWSAWALISAASFCKIIVNFATFLLVS